MDERKEPSVTHSRERIPWPSDEATEKIFDETTQLCLGYRTSEARGLITEALQLLSDCEALPLPSGSYRQGASFRQLALIAHLMGMSTEERLLWYEHAEILGISAAHAGHIIARIQDGTLERRRQSVENLTSVVFTSEDEDVEED